MSAPAALRAKPTLKISPQSKATLLSIPTEFTAYALVKSPMSGDLYNKIKLTIKNGVIESAEIGNHNMRMLVADQVMSEMLR